MIFIVLLHLNILLLFKVFSFPQSSLLNNKKSQIKYQIVNYKKTILYSNLKILEDEKTVGIELSNILKIEYQKCIKEKGSFK
jgi:hypothetical protein